MRPQTWSLLPLLATLPIPDSVSASECKTFTPRREWRTMTEPERAKWISALKCLMSITYERLSFAADGSAFSRTHTLYDQFSYAHHEAREVIHDNAYFLPWHRWFLKIFYDRLGDTCDYHGPQPYWDWSLDFQDLSSSPVFDPDPIHGLGREGDCINSACYIQNGAFASTIFAHPIAHPLTRNLSLTLNNGPQDLSHNVSMNPTNILNITRQNTPGDFFRFQYQLTHVHNDLHNFVGGDFAGVCPEGTPWTGSGECENSYTPNDPLFWLHHGNLDRLWSN
ncbi:hypothetical protein BDK51DRAFT_30068, partial [Blyttiomyces helicus]